MDRPKAGKGSNRLASGEPLATVKYNETRLTQRFGSKIGRISRAVCDLDAIAVLSRTR